MTRRKWCLRSGSAAVLSPRPTSWYRWNFNRTATRAKENYRRGGELGAQHYRKAARLRNARSRNCKLIFINRNLAECRDIIDCGDKNHISSPPPGSSIICAAVARSRYENCTKPARRRERNCFRFWKRSDWATWRRRLSWKSFKMLSGVPRERATLETYSFEIHWYFMKYFAKRRVVMSGISELAAEEMKRKSSARWRNSYRIRSPSRADNQFGIKLCFCCRDHCFLDYGCFRCVFMFSFFLLSLFLFFPE